MQTPDARRFTDAAHSLTEPHPAWIDGALRWQESLYTRLREALTARTARSAAASGSRLPCRVDVLTLLAAMDATVAQWWPDAHTTPDRLRKMSGQHWTPEQADTLAVYATTAEAWVTAAAELLGDRMVSVALRKPCPSCGQLWAYRRSGAETVRAYALTASERGAECAACRANWQPSEFGFLARLLSAGTTLADAI